MILIVQRAAMTILLTVLLHTTAFAWSHFPVLQPNQIVGPSDPQETTPPQTWLFGQTMLLEEHSALIGMPGWFDSMGGRVAEFTREHGQWRRIGTLEPRDSSAGDAFGLDIAGTGDPWLVISKHLFRRRHNTWKEVGPLQGLGVIALTAQRDTIFSSGFIGTEEVRVSESRKTAP